MTKHWIGIVDLIASKRFDIYFAGNRDHVHWFSEAKISDTIQSLDEFVFSSRAPEDFNILAPKELSYWSKEDEIT